jgi:hypothetical protein
VFAFRLQAAAAEIMAVERLQHFGGGPLTYSSCMFVTLFLMCVVCVQAATAEIAAGERPRALVQRDIKRKEAARQTLARKYK